MDFNDFVHFSFIILKTVKICENQFVFQFSYAILFIVFFAPINIYPVMLEIRA